MRRWAKILVGAAVGILLLSTAVSDLTAAQEYRYWTSGSICAAETLALRARDYNNGNYFYGVWSIAGTVTGACTLTVYRLKYDGTTQTKDSLRIALPVQGDSTPQLFFRWCLGDSMNLRSLGAGNCLKVTAIGGEDSQRGVKGPLLY